MPAPTLAKQSRDSVLFVTLDSCRYDTFANADIPTLRRVGPLHRAQAPSYYTYGSHSAMFVGFTPGLAHLEQPLLNPKFGKLFKLVGGGHPGKGTEAFELQGRNIVEGFSNRGHATIGTGAVGWFDPGGATGRHLTDSFQHYFYAGDPHSLGRQLDFLSQEIARHGAGGDGRDVFAFLNVGETHVPYWHEGAAWDRDDNPCHPFQKVDRAADCRDRQTACLEFVDRRLAPLLDAFQDSTILLCGDHGDAWGEDGIWEHGISHPAVLTVPLLIRARGEPVAAREPVSA